jgi:hypothetical protein
VLSVLSVLLGHAVGQPDDLCDLNSEIYPTSSPGDFAFIQKYQNAE